MSRENHELFYWGDVEYFHEKTLTPKSIPFRHSEKVSQVGCNDEYLVLLLNDGSVYTVTQGPIPSPSSDESSSTDNRVRRRFFRKRGSVSSLGVELTRVEVLRKCHVTQIACATPFNLALTTTGQVYVWKNPENERTVRWLSGDYLNPLPEFQKKKVLQVSSGFYHFLALCDDATVYSWGLNQYGELGRLVKKSENADSYCYPKIIEALLGIPIDFIACGGYHSWAITKNGVLYSWGCNAVGQLGLGDESDRTTPSPQQTLKKQRIKYIACGEFHTVFLSEDGLVYTCGSGADGQLGHRVTEDSAIPQIVLSLADYIVTQVACGRRHTIVYVQSTKTVYTFGQRWFRQLGFCHKSSHDFFSPSAVLGPWSSMEEIRSSRSSVGSSSSTGSTGTTYSMKCLYAGSYYSIAQVSTKRSSHDFRLAINLPLTLSLDKAKDIIRLSATKIVPEDIRHYIRSVFSVSSVNGFFLSTEECSRTDPQIDMPRVYEVFAELGKAKNPAVVDLLLNALEELISSLGIDPVDMEGLVVYVALPECHFFQEPAYYATTSLPFAKAFCRLPKSSRNMLLNWWTCNSADHFKTIAAIYKASLAYILKLPPAESRLENMLRNQSVQMSVRILSHLCWINKKRNLGLSSATFQVPSLEEYVDLAQDYLNWISDRRSKKRKNVFHFCSYPYIFGPAAKATLLHVDAEMHQRRAMKEAMEWNVLNLFVPVGKRNPYLTLKVSRKNVVGDTLKQLADCNRKDLKKPLRIIFEGEEAIDHGGLSKEFFTIFMQEALDPNYGLFIETEGETLWFNQYSFDSDSMYALVGIACGLAAYNNNIISARFPLALYKMLLKEKTTLSDLNDLYPSIMKGLRQLLRHKHDDVEQVFQLYFQASQDVYGKSVDTELTPGGAKIPVTQENKREYVHLYLEYLVYRSVKEKIIAFSTGFRKVCSSCVLNVFLAEELRGLLIGSEDYNWLDLQANAEYQGEFCSAHPTIRAFWKVFHKFDAVQKKKFLMFLTGTDRVPAIGMKDMKIVVRPMVGNEEYLPVAHTCFNTLDLPIYKSQKKLRSKLLQAIDYVEGFTRL